MCCLNVSVSVIIIPCPVLLDRQLLSTLLSNISFSLRCRAIICGRGNQKTETAERGHPFQQILISAPGMYNWCQILCFISVQWQCPGFTLQVLEDKERCSQFLEQCRTTSGIHSPFLECSRRRNSTSGIWVG